MNDSRRMGNKMNYMVDKLTKETAMRMLYDQVFRSCQLFERLEAAGKLQGSGKWAAQQIADQAQNLLSVRWKNEVPAHRKS